MKRLPRLFTAVALSGGCSAPVVTPDAGHDAGAPSNDDAGTDAGYDAGVRDAGAPDAGRHDGGTPYGDAGCVLPSDFPWDADSPDVIAQEACQCVYDPQVFHCFEEDGPRCFRWACPPAVSADGGYVYFDDGGVECLC
jgi:hypothetical protein